MKRYRYPGPTPFSAAQEDIFFGREFDADQIFNSVLLNSCTLLCGKSGVGKSSLLNAKIIPRFNLKQFSHEADKRLFVVVRVSVGPWTERCDDYNYLTLAEKVAKLTKDGLGSQEFENVFLGFLDNSKHKSLGLDIKRYQHEYYLKGKNIIVLMVIDQVEDMFTYPYNEFKELLDSFKEILSPHVPEGIREEIEIRERERPETITRAESEILYTPLHIKFLFSIRSDKLGLLIRLKESIPNIFTNPYELRPLTIAQATKAISFPCQMEGDFVSRKFIISDNAIEKITNYLRGLPNSDLENNFDDNCIDPISLQVVCQHVELKVAPYDADKIIEIHEITNLDEVFENYYINTLAKIQCDEVVMRRIRSLLEDRLIYEPDKRRRQLFREECDVSSHFLNKLADLKLLREILDNSGKSYFEIAHDWLIIPILTAKKDRLERENVLKQQRVSIFLTSNDYGSDDRSISFEGLFSKADYFFNDKQWDKAIEHFSKYLSYPERDHVDLDNEALAKRAECYFRIKDYENVVKDVLRCKQLGDVTFELEFYLVFAYHMMYQLEKAEHGYIALLEKDRTNVNCAFNLGVVYQELGKLEESKRMFLEVGNLSPSDFEGWYNAGVVCSKLGQYSDSISALKKALSLDNNSTECHFELGYAYSHIEDFEKAISSFYTAYNVDPTNIKALKQIELISRLIGDDAEAKKATLLTMLKEVKKSDTFLSLAELEFNRQNYNQTLEFLNQYFEIESNSNLEGLLLKAKTFRRLGREDIAVEIFEDIFKLGVYRTDILVSAIETCLKCDNLSKCRGFVKSNFDMIVKDSDLLLVTDVLISNSQLQQANELLEAWSKKNKPTKQWIDQKISIHNARNEFDLVSQLEDSRSKLVLPKSEQKSHLSADQINDMLKETIRRINLERENMSKNLQD